MDVFDTLTEPQQQSGDVFDQLAPDKSTDIFDQISGVTQPSSTPETDKALIEAIPQTMTPQEEQAAVSQVEKEHPTLTKIAGGAGGAAVELASGMIPRTPYQYAAQIFPPLAAYEQAKAITSGDVSSIPLVGRVPEIIKAEQTPAFSKERFATAARTLMDVGILAGAGAPRARVAEIPTEPVRPTEGEINAIQPSNAQMETRGITQRVEARPEGEIPPASYSDYAQREAQGAVAGRELPQEPVVGTETPPAQGTVRLYHGAAEGVEQAGRDFTTDLQYAKDYAFKASGEKGQVWYVDVPEGVLKTHDETGQPMTRVVVPDEIADQAKPLIHETVAPTTAAPEGTGIANKYLTEVYGDEAPVATTGKGPGAWKNEGISRLDNYQKSGDARNDPYAVLTNLRQGKVPMNQVPSDVSLLRAEHQRLVEDARNAEGTPEYAAKSQAALNMATAIKEVAHGPASDVFRALQEYDKPRYDNVTDFDQALRERTGFESTPQQKVQFKKIADDVATTRNGAEKEIVKVQRQLSKQPKMSFEDAYKRVHDQIAVLTKDCIL